MRTKTLLAAAAMLAAGLASSLAQSNVYSLNVVGYVNKVFRGGGNFTLVANPLNSGTNTLAGVFGGPGTGLPAGSQVQKWVNGGTDFVAPYIKNPATGWGAGGSANSVSVAPGEGFFVVINTPGDITNTFVGEVMQGNLTNNSVSGFNLLGNMVADSGAVTNMQFNPATGSQIQKWNVNSTPQDFFAPWILTPLGWRQNSLPNVPTIDAGEGFFFVTTSPYSWVRNFTVQ